MFSAAFTKSLVYAGFLSHLLAIVVCILFKEYERVPDESFGMSIWTFVYLLHKKRGTW